MNSWWAHHGLGLDAVELVLAGHVPTIGVPAPDSRAVCGCGAWRGVVRDWPVHLADVLDRAGLLAPGTPATSILAECRYCGQGWTFPAGTRQGPQEVRSHEAHCTAREGRPKE